MQFGRVCPPVKYTTFVKLIFLIFLDRAASSNNTLTQLYMYKIHHMVLQFVCRGLHAVFNLGLITTLVRYTRSLNYTNVITLFQFIKGNITYVICIKMLICSGQFVMSQWRGRKFLWHVIDQIPLQCRHINVWQLTGVLIPILLL
jgi:hypothetical protein